MTGQQRGKLPVACSLTPEQLRDRRASLIPGLVSRATDIAALEEGYRLTFPSELDIVSTIAATIDAERHCCAFLRFELEVPPGGGDVVLTLTGPAGTRHFLDALFDGLSGS